MIGLPFFYSCAAEIQIHFSTVTLAENVQIMKPVQNCKGSILCTFHAFLFLYVEFCKPLNIRGIKIGRFFGVF